MKRLILFLIVLLSASGVHADDYYWVGGAGSWSDLSHWASSSGGPGNKSIVPGGNDDVYFDANSGFGTNTLVTLPTTGHAYCRNMSWVGATGTPIFRSTTATYQLNISGNLELSAVVRYDVKTFLFSGAGNATAKFNGAARYVPGNAANVINVNKPGGSLTLVDGIPEALFVNIVLNTGHLNMAGNTHSVNIFNGQSSTLTRSLDISNATLVIGTSWDYRGNNGVLTATGSFIKATLFHSDRYTFPKVEVTGTSDQMVITGTTFGEMTFSNAAAPTGSVRIGASNIVDRLEFVGGGRIATGGSVINTLILGPGKGYIFHRNNTINTRLQLNTADCDALGQITGADDGRLTFVAGATADIRNVYIKSLTALGSIAPITVVGADGGSNTGFNFLPRPSGTTLYWVGGAGNWDDKSHWSNTSGGTGGACVPFTGDDVVFDANSGFTAAGRTVSVPGNAWCHNMTWTNVAAAPIFDQLSTVQVEVWGSLTLDPTVTMNGNLTMRGTDMNTLTTNGSSNGTLTINVTKESAAGGINLADDINFPGLNLQITRGQLNMAGRTLTVNQFYSASGLARVIDISNATINVTYWNLGATGVTWVNNAAGSFITSARGFTTNGLTYPKVHCNSINDEIIIQNTNIGELVFTNTAPIGGVRHLLGGNTIGTLEFKSGGFMRGNNTITNLLLAPSKPYSIGNTQTITGLFRFNNPDCTALGELRGQANNFPTLNFGPSAVLDFNNVYIQNLTATGAGVPITVTGADAGGNTGFNIVSSGSGARYWVGGSGDWSDPAHWSNTSGGAGGACVPTVSNDVYFDANSFTSGSSAVTINNSQAYCRNMNWTGANFSPTLTKPTTLDLEIWGNLVMNPLVRIDAALNLTGPANTTITSNGGGTGATQFVVLKPAGNSVTLLDDYTNTLGYFFPRGGNLDLSNRTISFNGLDDYASQGVINVNITGAFITGAWRYMGATKTVQAANSVIKARRFLVNSGDYNIVEALGGSSADSYVDNTTINSLLFTNPSGASQVFINGNNTIHRLEYKGKGLINGTNNIIDTLIFAPGKNYTLLENSNTTITKEWYGSGTPCNLTEITSTAGTATITKTSGDVEFDYVRLRGITAAGITPFKALEHSEDLGSNTNWAISPYNGSTPILGLGPDVLLCPSAFPYTINTDGFFASPLASFTWNDGSKLETLTVTTPGTYSVTVSYPDGCSRTDNVVITRSDVTAAPITGTTAVCNGRTTTLSSATTGGVWSTGNAAVATVSATGVVTGVAPGTATITYTVTNGNGCIATQTATITVNAVPVVDDITGTLSVFQNSTTTLSSTTTGGVWSSSNTAIATVSNTGVVSGIAPGTATITYTVTSPEGCDAAKTAIVTVDGFTADKRVLSITKTTDAAEPTTNGGFTINLPAGILAVENITVNYTVGGTAGTADYAAQSGTAMIAAGQNGVSLPVTVTDDALVEITETVIVTLSGGTGVKYTYTLSPTNDNATVNITDDENTPAKRTLSITNAGNAVEGGAAGKFRISLPTGVATSEDITVTYTIAGTATNGVDYTTLSGTATISAGQSGVDVMVTTINDQIIEGNETVILTLAGGTTATIGNFTGTTAATVNIADDDNTAANRTLSVSNIQNAAEPSTNGSMTIGLPAGVSVTEAINVNYAVTGTAVSGVDYTALSGTVTIPAGQNSVTIPILVIDDALVELTETVIITIQNSSSASFTFAPGTIAGSGTVSIADDDNIAANRVISITKTADAAEPATSGAFRIGLPSGIIASENISVSYTVSGSATAGADYVALSGMAVIPAGANGIDLPVNVLDDTEIENTEGVAVILNVANATNLTYTISITQNIAEVTIADDDFAGNSNVVLLTKVSDAIEGGAQGQYRISLKPGVTSSQNIVVNFTLGGTATNVTDYTLVGLTGGNIVIPAGANEVLINVNALNDAIVEGPEDVVLTLTSAASASYPFVVDPGSNSATVNIVDMNAAAGIPVEVIAGITNASEPSTHGTFTVKLAGVATSSYPVTVGYTLSGTAVSGLDYQALGTIVIPANTNSMVVNLNILDDQIIEPVETVIFTLLSGSATDGTGAFIFPPDATNNQVTINIADDDQVAAHRVLTVVKTTDAAEPATGGVYTVSLPAGYTSSTPITLNYNMFGSATRNTDYTITGNTLPANRNSVTIPVPVIDDQIIEGTEVLSLHMVNGTDGNGFTYTVDPATTEVDMNITDDDADPAKLKLAVTNSGNAAEPATNGQFTISLPTGVTAAVDITVNYTVSGTATAGSDYVALPATLTIPAGQNSITVPVTVTDDQLVENTETVILTLTGGTAGSLNLTPVSGSSNAIVNITDDENTAANTVISITAGTNATEGTADVSSFTISLPTNILTPEDITVAYTVSGTATNGTDYTSLSGTAVIAAGQNSVVVSTPAVDDDIVETDETIILTLTGATSNGFSWIISPTANEATTLIIDNDNTTANLTLDITKVTDATEPATNGMFRISLPAGITVVEDVTVNYTVTGTATAGADYTTLTGTAIIAAGQNGINIPVTVIDDQEMEPTETVIVTLNGGTSTNFTLTGTGSATVDIADDESSVPANLALTISKTTDAAEPATNGSFSINLPAGITIAEDVTITYNITGTATAGTDYTALSGTAVILAGQTSVSIPVTVIDDQLIEQTETVIATLNGGSSTSFTFTGAGSATVNITDDESVGSLTLAISKTADGAEPATNGGFEISLPAGVLSSEDITVNYTVSGTATRDADYTALSGTVIIAAGQNSVSIPVTVIDDQIVEMTETVMATLNGGSSANFTFTGTGSATVNIADNDNTPANLALTITKLNDASEPATAGRVSIALPAGITAAESITVTYNVGGSATPGADYAALSGTVTIPAGENSVMVPVSVIDDQVIETTETVILTLNGGNSTNFTFTGTGSITVNIADDDNVPANLVLNAAVNIAAGEPDVAGSFTVALPAGMTATEDITVTYAVGGTATADEDYSGLTGIAVIPAGSNSVDVAVNILDDKIIEGTETLTIEITGGTSASLAFTPGPDKTAAMDIADDDTDPANMILSIVNSANAAEPGTNGGFTISLPPGALVSEAITVTYTVSGTATAGTDYTALTGTAVIPALGNSVTIPVTVIDDELIEQLETVIVTLNNSTSTIGTFTIGAANTATVNITDNDATGNLKLGVTATQSAAAEPATNGEFTISIAGGKLTSEAITVQYTIGGSATPDADYQAISGIITIPAGANSVIVPVNVLNDEEVEDPETVVFTITGGTSANFSWTPDTNSEAIVTIASDDVHTGNLMITKQMVSPAIGPYRLGQDITYRVTVTNIGTGVSAGVTVADFLASQLGQPTRTVASIGQTSFNAADLRINWTIGDMAAGASAQLEVTYRLTDGGSMVLTAEAASTNTDTDPADNKATLNLLVEGSDLLFPNTFTPNGDGKNERFIIGGLDKYQGAKLQVFNRWGAQVYRSNDYRNDWNGSGLAESTYYYILEVKKTDGSVKAYKGWVLIVR